MPTHRIQRRARVQEFDKYDLYQKAVQSPDTDAAFIQEVFRELHQKPQKKLLLREDFCGTFLLSCEWVKLSKGHSAVALDLDPEPLSYGRQHYLKKLNSSQQARLKVIEGNVLNPNLEKVDIVAAFNFSYFLFRTRAELKAYFQNVFSTLKQNGVFIIDAFGGSLCQDENRESTRHKSFTYFWDQKSFDPVTAEAKFEIHFQLKGKKKIESVFQYHWRMWTLPELRELLLEVGFAKTHVYWEGTNRKGGGDGKFKRVEEGEACEAWIAYVVAEK